MRKTDFTMLALLLSASAFALPAFSEIAAPPVAIIGLSAQGRANDKTREVKSLLEFAVEQTGPGQESIFVDALHNETLCSFTVPDKSSYSSPKAKLNVNGKCVGKLLKLAKQAEPGSQGANLNPTVFLKNIADTYDMTPDTVVVLSGSPIVDDQKEPNFSMADSFVGTDGNVYAAQDTSPYSLAGYEDKLGGAKVYWITPDSNWALNSDHEYQVKQFWGLSVGATGGELVTLTHDDRRALSMAASRQGKAPTFTRSGSDKVEMVQVVPPFHDIVPIHERRLSSHPLDDASLYQASNIEIGITWNCGGCDVDLHVTPKPGAQKLYYGQRYSNEGQFHKDFTSGRALANGLERVSLYGPLDLSRMRIEVKHFSGLAPNGIDGEIRIAVGGETYGRPFRLEPKLGGVMMKNITIDPMDVLN